MAEGPSRKRSFMEDDDLSNNPPSQKRVRFPKGKKVKTGDFVVDDQPNEDGPIPLEDPQLVAKERRRRRTQMAADLLDEENRGILPDITRAEVQYKVKWSGLWYLTLCRMTRQLLKMVSRWNLLICRKREEEGYFDPAGNYIEFLSENEIKDAWLDSVVANKTYASSTFAAQKSEDDVLDLSYEDIGKINRRIADTLEPGETVLQALRRLKGTSYKKKEKMSPEIKQLFDQLTEDAMMLMDNGDYNVYNEKKETFQREAEGYEKLAVARRHGISTDSGPGTVLDEDFIPDKKDNGKTASIFYSGNGASDVNISATTNNVDGFDIFGEDENASNLDPSKSSQPSESGDMYYDYVYDESSGYYYSSRLGYYYDPSSGLYCYAASGQWFSYNEESRTYDEVQQAANTQS
ncbi:hypothetical protein ACH5RR_022443 [Cinchona calisaya]|uniref:OCRE domain-containing protein n=1 Tax=Cinchona calisaya TaxID=153742 RepID=A0ABD2Z7T3_9GENT